MPFAHNILHRTNNYILRRCVPKPAALKYETCAAILCGGLLSYTAFQHLHRIAAGDVVVIANGNSAGATIMIQLAHLWGARVLVCVRTLLVAVQMRTDFPWAEVIDLSDRRNTLPVSALELTGGIGADVILDTDTTPFFSTAEILMTLAVLQLHILLRSLIDAQTCLETFLI